MNSFCRGFCTTAFCFDMSSQDSFNEMKLLFYTYLKNQLSVDVTCRNAQQVYQIIHDALGNKRLCIIGLKKEIRQVSSLDIQEFLLSFIDTNFPFMKRKLAYFEQSVHLTDKLFYPFMFGAMEDLLTPVSSNLPTVR